MNQDRVWKGRSIYGPGKSAVYLRHRNDDDLGSVWKFWRRKRFIITILAFFGFLSMFANRANLSVALTAMVKSHGDKNAEFNWSSITEGFILSSFYYGYIVLQLPGGWLSHKIGGVKLFGFGVGIPSFLALYTDYFARASYIGLIILRMTEGLFQGVCYPAMHDVWAHWLPPLERNTLTSLAYSGTYVGIIIAMTTSGVIATRLGWPAVFRVFGGIGTVWYGFWLAFVYRLPEDDVNIDYRELRYLRLHLMTKYAKRRVPWREIFKSRPVYALIICHVAINWGGITMLTQLPMFIHDVLGFNLQSSGFLSAVPCMVMTCAAPITGRVVDFILRKNIFTVTAVRKTFMVVGFILEGTLIFFVGFTTKPVYAILMITLGMTSAALSEPNYIVSHLDIAPQYAAILLGICSTFATLSGMITPVLTSYFVKNHTRNEWKLVFMIVAGVYWFAAFFYLLFGTSELQEWAIEYEENEGDSKLRESPDEDYHKGREMSLK